MKDTSISVLLKLVPFKSTVGFVKVILWPVSNGWLGRYIDLSGISISSIISPIWYLIIEEVPDVPTPTDWGGLKNTTSSTLESNCFVLTEIVKLLFKASTLDPNVWAEPTCLNTLNALFVLKTFNTFNSSVVTPTPILIDPPIETLDGILLTKISWTTPAELLAAIIDFAKPTLSVETPTLNVSLKFNIVVLNPTIDTDSSCSISKNGERFTCTWFGLFQVNMTLLNLSSVVSILDTPIPTISETSAVNPEPFVPSSSNDVKSPIWYPDPPSKIFIFSIDPCVIDSIDDICLIFSYDSVIKSLSANCSPTLYG